MEEDLKTLGVWAGIGAALGAGVAIGMGFRVLASGAAIGVGAGVALGVLSRTRRIGGPHRRMIPAWERPALH